MNAFVLVVQLAQPVEEGLRVRQKLALVALEREHVVGSLPRKLLGNLLLTAHRLDADEASRHVEKLQESGNSRELIGFIRSLDLPECQVVLRRPGAYHVNGRLLVGGVLVASAEGLSVYGNDLSIGLLEDRLNPSSKARLKLFWVEACKYAPDGIV